MRILTVIGARPHFIKAGPVSAALKKLGVDEILVHTGQHYDRSMSQVFFDEGIYAKHKWQFLVKSALAIAACETESAVGGCMYEPQAKRGR